MHPVQELLGDAGNRRVLRAAVGRLVCMRQHEQMSVAQATARLRTSALPFLPAAVEPGGSYIANRHPCHERMTKSMHMTGH